MLRPIFMGISLALAAAIAHDVAAAPLKYSISFTGAAFQGNSSVNPLEGARIEAVVSFNPDTLTPLADMPVGRDGWVTAWPLTNTFGWVNISGTADDDGRYPAEVIQEVGWHFFRNDAGGVLRTNIFVPPLRISFRDDVLNIHPLLFLFPFDSGNRNALPPAPIAPNELRGWYRPRVTFLKSGLHFDGMNPTGYAAYVPEPSCAAVLAAPIALAALRRRK